MSTIRTLAASAALILVLGAGQASAQVVLSLGGNQASPYAAPVYGNPVYSSPVYGGNYLGNQAIPGAAYPYGTTTRYAQPYAASPYYASPYNQGYYTTPNGMAYNPYQANAGRAIDLGNGIRYYSSGYNGLQGQPGYNYGGVPGANYRNLQFGPVTISAPR